MEHGLRQCTDRRWPLFPHVDVLDLYTRESLALVADRSLTGIKVAAALSEVLRQHAAPQAITVDNGGEFVGRAMDAWAYAHDVRLDFIRPGAVGAMWVDSREARESTAANEDRIELETGGRFVTISPS
jgi:transposase InsO family protein